MLQISGELGGWTSQVCGTCSGKGRVPCPEQRAVRSGVLGFNARGAVKVPGAGAPIPCPECNGKKFVVVAVGVQ